MSDTIFNYNKTDYGRPVLILGPQAPGLFDTINKHYPEIWEIYKRQKSLDWDENEAPHAQSLLDFESCDEATRSFLIRTLSWQFESDSVFSRAIGPVFAPFISSSELWAAWQKVSEIEVLHAAAYSEIVRGSFKDPSNILDEILQVQQAHDRLKIVVSAFRKGYKASHEYALGLRKNDQALYNEFMTMLVALYLGERVQFMSSFAVTFGICESGLFQSIGKIIQKICQDEFECHAQLDKIVLKYELKTERGQAFLAQCGGLIKEMVDEVIQSESDWVDYLYSDGRNLVGITPDMLKGWTLYCAADVIHTLGFQNQYKLPKKNPLKYMENWINIGLIQNANQEETATMYKLNIMRRDDEGFTFDLDF